MRTSADTVHGQDRAAHGAAPRPRRRTGVWTALVAAGALMAVAGFVPRAASAADGITITGSDVSQYPKVVVDLEAPTGSAPLESAEVAVTENGKPVVAQLTRLADEGLEVLLLVDASGSMIGQPMQQARGAVSEFLERLPAEVRIGLVSFGDDVRVLSPPTLDRGVVSGLVKGIQPDGETRLYDAVVTARTVFSATARERVIVILSDGGDTTSESTLAEAAAAVSGLRVEVVSLETKYSNELALVRLAIDGRGKIVPAANPAGLASAYGEIARSIVNRYELRYTSTVAGPAAVKVTTLLGAAESTVQMPGAAPTTVAPTTAAPAPTTAPATTAPATATTAAPAPSATAAATTAVPAATPTAAPTTTVVASDKGWMQTIVAGGIGGCIALVALAFGGRLPGRRRQQYLNGEPVGVMIGAEAPRRGRKHRRKHRRGRVVGDDEQPSSMAEDLAVAGIRLRPVDFATVVGSLAMLAFLVSLWRGAVLVGAVLALVIVLAAIGLVEFRVRRRRARFAQDFPGVVPLLVSALRSGHDLPAAVEIASEHAPGSVVGELQRVADSVRNGREPGDALATVARRMRNQELEMVVAAVRLHKAVGGDLARLVACVDDTTGDGSRASLPV